MIHPGGVTSRGRAGANLRAVTSAIDFVRRSVERFIALEGFDRAMALAGQAFAAFLPLLIVISAVSPAAGKDAASSLIDRLQLNGEAADAVRAAVAQPAAIEDGVSVLGVVILVFSALAFTRALQRLYVRAWGLDKIGVRGNVWGLLWLLAFAAYWSIQPAILAVFSAHAEIAVSLATSFALWLFTPWLLVGRQIAWRRLLPQALLSSVGLTCLGIAAALYMPRAVGSAAAQFGFIGVAFALLSFLFAMFLVLVVTTALGSTLAESGPIRRKPPAAITRSG